MFVDSFYEDCKLDVELRTTTHMTHVLSQEICWTTLLEGQHSPCHQVFDFYRVLVCIWVCEWALERWEEGTQVSLKDDLREPKALYQNDRLPCANIRPFV